MTPNPKVVINQYSKKNWRNWNKHQLGPERVKILLEHERKQAAEHTKTMFDATNEEGYLL